MKFLFGSLNDLRFSLDSELPRFTTYEVRCGEFPCDISALQYTGLIEVYSRRRPVASWLSTRLNYGSKY